MATPLYQKLKENGYSTFVFPSVAEDISLAYQNDNYKMNFSKFALLKIDLTKLNTDVFNTESTNVLTDKGDLLVNHLRNYIANEEVVIKNSMLNNSMEFYNSNEIRTTSERIFWKWMRKTGMIEFEPAIPNDEYVDITEFSVDETKPNDYFKEFLWKERSVNPYNILNISQETFDSPILDTDGIYKNIYKLQIESTTNIKPNDIIELKSIGTVNIGFTGSKKFTVNNIESENNKNDVVFILSDSLLSWNNSANVSINLVYERVLKYIGEISSVNNVNSVDKSYTQITAFIPDQNGQTPDVLFRLRSDSNYSPSLQYPILSSQDQPEIVGAEQFNSPINLNPSNYAGDQYAYFDADQKYINSSGDETRKTGDYYGINSDDRTNSRISAPYVYPEFDGKNIDGISVDFDTNHYTKMNIPSIKTTDFDSFSAQAINGLAPSDFEFNVILWYYQVEDKTKLTETDTTTTLIDGSTITTTNINTKSSNVSDENYIGMNLYGITILNGINPITQNIDTYKKLVANGKQDGLSYNFNLNLNFDILNDNVYEYYDPNKAYSEFGFDLYNTVMRQVIQTNDIYLNLNTQTVLLKQEIEKIKTLFYTQTSITDINSRIASLYKLINLYKTSQITNSDSIVVSLDESVNPPMLKLNSIDSRYGTIKTYPVSLLYNSATNTVSNTTINVPTQKDFLVNIINDDIFDTVLDSNINIVLDKDLDYKQVCEIKVFPKNSKYNKKINISVLSKLIQNIDTVKGYSLLSGLDLPIDNNLDPNKNTLNILDRLNEYVDIIPNKIGVRKIADEYFIVLTIEDLKISAFRTGDVVSINNVRLSAYDINNNYIFADVSGQYTILGDIVNNELVFKIKNTNFEALYTVLRKINTTDFTINIGSSNIEQVPFISINSGFVITITCVDANTTDIKSKYLVDIKKYKKLNR